MYEQCLVICTGRGYEEKLSSFTRSVVQYQLKNYRVPPRDPGRQRMLTPQNTQADQEKYDNKEYHITNRAYMEVNGDADNVQVKLSMFATHILVKIR